MAEPPPTLEPDGQLAGLLWTTDFAQLANFEAPNVRFLSKWMTARRVANGGSPGTGVVFVTMVRRLTLRGLASVPARLLSSRTEIVCVPWIADATAVMPSAPTTAAAQTSATLRIWVSPPGGGSEGTG